MHDNGTYNTGTSFAAPHVAGVAALALGKCPALTYSALKERILNNSDPLPSLSGKCQSGGRLNAYKVLYDPSNPTIPNAPTNLVAYPTAWNTIELYWQDNSNNEIGFEIQRSNNDKPIFLRLTSASENTTHFVDGWAYARHTESGDVAHEYRIRAGNMGGMSSFSTTASATIPYTVPAAPSDLSAPSITFVSVPIELTWTDNANNEQNFVIERKRQGTGSWTQVAAPPANSTTYTDHATLGGTYYYRIKAQNPVGFSSYSSQITVEVESY